MMTQVVVQERGLGANGGPTGRRAPVVMAVVAHPDDETFGCGSLLLHAAAQGAHTVVVCATRGEAGEVAPGVAAPGGVAALREAELRSAAQALGVDEVEVLGFVDSGMAGEPASGTLCAAPIDDVTTVIGAALERHHPDVVIVLDGGDGHRDHVQVRGVVEGLLEGTSATVYRHCLPRSLMHDWVRHHAGDDDAAAYVELPEIGTPDDELTTIIDTGPFLTRRETAVALHRSQRSPFDGLPDGLRRGFLAREQLVRVNPPWSGGPMERELHGLHSLVP